MPRLQIALDTYDLPSALAPLATAVDQIDIIECGTIPVSYTHLTLPTIYSV